jgi:formyltetrahydrofolate deformylase
MTEARQDSATLLISCPDRKGIVAAVTRFLFENQGNIIDLEQHVDAEESVFFMRVEWSLDGFRLSADQFGPAFGEIARDFAMTWELRRSTQRTRMAVFVTREPHCLYDILARHQAGEWNADIPLVISNHEDLRPVAERFSLPFHVFPKTPETRQAMEEQELKLLHQHGVDTIVLARYMQILSGTFIAHYPNRILNIHHSFLPAFPGSRPYHSAHARGVKIIGATCHYITEELDQGPIIAQDVVHVTHRDDVADLIRKGKDVEKIVLARAITAHVGHRILVHGNRTVVFG